MNYILIFLQWKAKNANKAAKTELTVKTIPVVIKILPKPTIGETMLPAKNPDAPSTADAVPACFLAELSANEVTTGKERPIIKHKINNIPSKNTIDELFTKIVKIIILHIIMPILLILRESS